MRTNTTRALLWACAAAVVGCTSSGNEDAGAELGSGTGSLATFRLERFQGREATGGSRLVTNAKIARYSGLDGSSVLKLLGVDGRDGEGCSVGQRLDAFPLAPEAHVELLSIGEISLRIGERSQTFAPRLFPDLANTASGWFYAGEAELAAGAPSASERDGGPDRNEEYVLTAAGDQGLGRFELTVSAPGPVQGLQIDGRVLAGVELGRERDVALSWEPEDMRDQIELEINAGGSVLSCAARDDGSFSLPQSKLAQLEADPQALVVIRRVRAVAPDMQGIESALVRFATTATFELSVR